MPEALMRYFILGAPYKVGMLSPPLHRWDNGGSERLSQQH